MVEDILNNSLNKQNKEVKKIKAQSNKKYVDFAMRFTAETFEKMKAFQLATGKTYTSVIEDATAKFLDSKGNKELVEKGKEILDIINKCKEDQ